MDRPTRGEIEFEGVSFSSAADGVLTDLRCRKIGFIFQSFNLLPTLTVLENAALPLRFAGRAPAEARAAGESWLEKVGLSHRAGHFPSQLSGGEKQRAAIARALVASPSLIIADEPTGSLDSENGRNVTALLSKMHQEHGIAILMATHDASVAAAAQRIVYMKDGQISQPT
jgi:ABC-type lipoprotein export system ATPase subunit